MNQDSGITVDQMIDAAEGLPVNHLLGRLMAVLERGSLDAAGFLRECDDMRSSS